MKWVQKAKRDPDGEGYILLTKPHVLKTQLTHYLRGKYARDNFEGDLPELPTPIVVELPQYKIRLDWDEFYIGLVEKPITIMGDNPPLSSISVCFGEPNKTLDAYEWDKVIDYCSGAEYEEDYCEAVGHVAAAMVVAEYLQASIPHFGTEVRLFTAYTLGIVGDEIIKSAQTQ